MKKKAKEQWKIPLGYSPVEETKSGAGFHGKSRKNQRREERRRTRRELKRGDWD